MLFGLGFISGILLCIFVTSIVRRTNVVQRVEEIIDPPPHNLPPTIGEIVVVEEVDRIKRTEDGDSLDDAYDRDQQ